MAEETTGDPTRVLHGLMPFARTLAITVLRYEPAQVRARLIVRTSQTQLVLSGLTGGVPVTKDGPGPS